MNRSNEVPAPASSPVPETTAGPQTDLTGARLKYVRYGLGAAALLLAADTFQPMFANLFSLGWQAGAPFNVTAFDTRYFPAFIVKAAASLWLTFAVWCAAATCLIALFNGRDLGWPRRLAGALLLWHAAWVLWAFQLWGYDKHFGYHFYPDRPDVNFYLLMQTLALAVWPMLLVRLMLPAATSPSAARTRAVWLTLGYVAAVALVLPITDAAVTTSFADPLLLMGGAISGALIAAAPVGCLAFVGSRRAGASRRFAGALAVLATLLLGATFYAFGHLSGFYSYSETAIVSQAYHLMIAVGVALAGVLLLRHSTPIEIAPQAAPLPVAPTVLAATKNNGRSPADRPSRLDNDSTRDASPLAAPELATACGPLVHGPAWRFVE